MVQSIGMGSSVQVGELDDGIVTLAKLANDAITIMFTADINGASLLDTGSVQYLGLNGSGATLSSANGDHETPMVLAGNFKNLRVNIVSNANTDTDVVDILINSAGAVPSVSVTALTTGQFASSDNADVAVADKVIYRFPQSATGNAIGSGVSLELTTP